MRYNQTYKNILNELLHVCVNENSVYSHMLEYLEHKFEDYNISNETRIKILVNLLGSMTVQFTTAAMNASIDIATKELSLDISLENMQKQGQLLDAQIQKTKTDTTLANSQQDAINKQVVDNRYIKAISILSNFVSDNHQAGLTTPEGLSRYIFDLTYELLKSDTSTAKPTSFAMSKR